VSDEYELRYATSGDARLAFSVRGSGPHEIVYVADVTNQDLELTPEVALFTDRLMSFARCISYDQRGEGLSDPLTLDELPTLERSMADLHAVVLAADVNEAVLVGHASAGKVAVLYAATYPERTAALVLVNSFATIARSDDYPAGVSRAEYEEWLRYVEHVWGTGRLIRAMIPSVEVDEAQLRDLARMERQSLSPAAVGPIFRMQYATDVRAILPLVGAPTLVVHSTDDRFVPVEHGRYLATHIPNARFVELPGADHNPFLTGLGELLVEEIEEFLTGTRAAASHSRMLTTLLFSDIVGSTDHASAVGDRAWRALLDRHDDAIRRQLVRFGGRSANFTGDGIVATFDGPVRAIRCGAAIRDAARQIGLDVRVGIHTGEIEVRGQEIAGIAVHLAKRICDAAQSGELLVSRTVVDLVAGSGLSFDDRGSHDLKGIPEPWRLFAVNS
jgi:class 3 adenylate cyclase